MINLIDHIRQSCGNHSTTILAALAFAGVAEWADLNSIEPFYKVRDYIQEKTNSGSVYVAKFAAAIDPYDGEGDLDLPKRWRKAIRIKAVQSQQTYVSALDIQRWINYWPHCSNDVERYVLIGCIVEARTGARISDTKELDRYNIQDGRLTYVAKKTGHIASIPATPQLMSLLDLHNSMDVDISDRWYLKVIQRIAKRAGIDQQIKLNGVTRQKYEFLSSHDFRRGFCTNCYLSGKYANIKEISDMAGHTSSTMTEEHYICAVRTERDAEYDYLQFLDRLIQNIILC